MTMVSYKESISIIGQNGFFSIFEKAYDYSGRNWDKDELFIDHNVIETFNLEQPEFDK